MRFAFHLLWLGSVLQPVKAPALNSLRLESALPLDTFPFFHLIPFFLPRQWHEPDFQMFFSAWEVCHMLRYLAQNSRDANRNASEAGFKRWSSGEVSQAFSGWRGPLMNTRAYRYNIHNVRIYIYKQPPPVRNDKRHGVKYFDDLCRPSIGHPGSQVT